MILNITEREDNLNALKTANDIIEKEKKLYDACYFRHTHQHI